ncbi:MAG: hypothetical protein PHO33_03055 [Clostridia bacterium]|nr:hypothetical protein [Clostridia bacterium]
MFKIKFNFKIAVFALIFPLMLSGCVKKTPDPTAEQSLTTALKVGNFYNYSSLMTITNITNSVTTESQFEFYLTTDIVKYVGITPNEFSVCFERNPEFEDIWNFYDYNYLITGNTINLGYNYYPDNTDLVSTLSKLCGRFDSRLLVRSYFTHQGSGIYKILDSVKSNLNYTIFNYLPTYTLSEFIITVTEAKITHITAVYNKVGSSDKITYNVDYAYGITLTQPVEFIKNISVVDTTLSFEISETSLLNSTAEIRKFIVFAGTVAPDENECLIVYDEGTIAITTRTLTLDNALTNGTYTIGAWVLAENGIIDYYQSTFIIE